MEIYASSHGNTSNLSDCVCKDESLSQASKVFCVRIFKVEELVIQLVLFFFFPHSFPAFFFQLKEASVTINLKSMLMIKVYTYWPYCYWFCSINVLLAASVFNFGSDKTAFIGWMQFRNQKWTIKMGAMGQPPNLFCKH